MFTCKIEAGFRVFIFIILHFVLTNCIREDMSGCPRDDGGLALKFSYDINADSRLSTAQGVDRLAVFIFDEKGLFISQVNDSMTSINDDYVMELPYKQGSYQFVAWGGYDKSTYQTSECVPRKTYIDDFFLSVKRQEDNRVTNQPKLLYHGMHDIVELNSKEKTIVLINLKQMTNHIRVIAHNLNQDRSDNIYIEDNNGKYGYDSQFSDDDRITYIPIYEASSEQSNPLIADFNVMRLEKDREPRLRIADKTGTIRYDENLIGKLIGGNPNIDFEHNHDFTIEISFDNYIPVIIKINGWEIVNEEI